MKKMAAAALAVMLILSLTACVFGEEPQKQNSAAKQPVAYSYTEYPLERNGIGLHLDCMETAGNGLEKNILLVHGVTYSSHEFDVDYQDYSLVRFLAREGYAVWRLDIAGFGQSEEVEDGFLPDSDYAAEDICAAVDKICEVSGAYRQACALCACPERPW